MGNGLTELYQGVGGNNQSGVVSAKPENGQSVHQNWNWTENKLRRNLTFNRVWGIIVNMIPGCISWNGVFQNMTKLKMFRHLNCFPGCFHCFEVFLMFWLFWSVSSMFVNLFAPHFGFKCSRHTFAACFELSLLAGRCKPDLDIMKITIKPKEGHSISGNLEEDCDVLWLLR